MELVTYKNTVPSCNKHNNNKLHDVSGTFIYFECIAGTVEEIYC